MERKYQQASFTVFLCSLRFPDPGITLSVSKVWEPETQTKQLAF